MAIARDTSTTVTSFGSGTSTSFSHTCSGNQRFLTVGTFHGWTSGYQAATNVAVTYNGTPMTLATTSQYRTYVMYTRHWYLANPSSGTNTVSVTWTGSVGGWYGSVSYTGVDQINPVVGSNTTYSSSNVTSISANIDVGSENGCWWTSVALLSNCTAANTSPTNVITNKLQAANDGIAFGDSDGTIRGGTQTGGWSSENLSGTNHLVFRSATGVQPFVSDAKTYAIYDLAEASATTTWDNKEGDSNWDMVPVSGSEPAISTDIPNTNYTRSRLFDHNDYATVTVPTEFQNHSGAFSVGCMLKMADNNATDTEGIVAVYGTATTARKFLLQRNTASTGGENTLNFAIIYGDNQYAVTSTAISRKIWHYVECVFIPSTSLAIYVDGNLNAINTTSIPATMDTDAGVLCVGRYNSTWGTANAFDGWITDIRISSAARTPKEIYEHWANETISTISDSASLSAGLISYWKLDETSGTRNDSKGTNHLSDNGTVGYSSSGIRGNAADFETSGSPNEYLSITDAAQTGLDVGNTWSMSAWIKPETVNVAHGLIGKSDGTISASGGWYVYINASNQIEVFWIRADNTNYALFYTTSGVIASAGTWYHIVATVDVAVGAVVVYVNGVPAPLTTYRSQTTITTGSTQAFQLGAITASPLYTDGLLDEIGLWSRVLSAGEAATLNNGGVSLQYDVTLVSFVPRASFFM